MQQARPANAVECKAEVGLRAIAVRMDVPSNGTLHSSTVHWRRSTREFLWNSQRQRAKRSTNCFNNNTIKRILRSKWSELASIYYCR